MSNASSFTSSKRIPKKLVTELEKNIDDLINNYDVHFALKILQDLLVKQGLGLGPLSNRALGDTVTGDIKDIKLEYTPPVSATPTPPTILQSVKTRLQQGQKESQDNNATQSSLTTSTQYISTTTTTTAGSLPSKALPKLSSASSSFSSTSSSIAPPLSLPFLSSSETHQGRKRKRLQREIHNVTQNKQRELTNELIDDRNNSPTKQARNSGEELRVENHTQMQHLKSINEAMISTLSYTNWVTVENLKIKNAVNNMKSIQQQQRELESREICELEKLYKGIEVLSKTNLVVKILTRIKLMLFYMKKEEDHQAYADWKRTNDQTRNTYVIEKSGKRFLEIFDIIGSTLFILTDSITTPRVRLMTENEFRIFLIYLRKHKNSSFNGIRLKDLDKSGIKNNDNSIKATFLKKLEILVLQKTINNGWVKETCH